MEQASLNLGLLSKKTRKQIFPQEMEKLVPWADLEALVDTPLYHQFAQRVVNATLMAAPSPTKNKDHARNPEMHPSKKGEQMYFGMKGHIGADAESGLMHTVRGTSGNVHDIVKGNSLLHGSEKVTFGDAGYQGIDKRPDAKSDNTWHIAMRPGKRKALNKDNEADALIAQLLTRFALSNWWMVRGQLMGAQG